MKALFLAIESGADFGAFSLTVAQDILARWLSRRVRLEAEDAAAFCALNCRDMTLERGAVIEARADALFVILEGWTCTYKLLGDGQRQICAIHIDGDAPNLRSFLLRAGGQEYRTLAPCRLGIIPLAALRDVCDRSHMVAGAVMGRVATEAAISEEWVVNIGRRKALNRVAHLFCELVARLDAIKGVRFAHTMHLTQTDIGDATGLSTVHVNRVLQELRAGRFLDLPGNRLLTPDRAKLAELAGFDPGYLHLATASD